MKIIKDTPKIITPPSFSDEERKVTGDDKQAMAMIRDAGQRVKPYDTQMIGFATVFMYLQNDGKGVQYVAVPDLRLVLEQIALEGSKALARAMMREYGKDPAKKKGKIV